MARLFLVAALLAAAPAAAADLRTAPAQGRFRATCEDLATLCFADACGRDQIDAALACRSLCPSSVVLGVAPASCPLPEPQAVLRRRG